MKKTKSLTPDVTIEKIVQTHQDAKELLASIGLKPSQYKEETLRSICQQRKWSEVEVLNWVKRHANGIDGKANSAEKIRMPDSGDAVKKWSVYFNEVYLVPVENLLKEIDKNFPRVYKIHGNQYTWLKNMQWYYESLQEALRMYQMFERETFLPVAKSLSKARSAITHGKVKRLKKCFSVIERDQKRIKRLMEKVKQKGNNFESPELACSTLCILNENIKLLYEKLEAKFDFESEQLIPRVEQELKGIS